MNTLKLIKKQINDNSIILYMKGSPESPHCGFSAKAAQALLQCNVKFAYINILENNDIRFELPKFANWPTFPQLWVNKKLIGGCDIITKMFNNGELQKLLNTIKIKNK